jgi:hypothetical protein
MRNSKCDSCVDKIGEEKENKYKEHTMETGRVKVDYSTTLLVAGCLKFYKK